jgi:hypothetical protein
MRAVGIVQDAGFTPVEAANAEIYRLDNFLHLRVELRRWLSHDHPNLREGGMNPTEGALKLRSKFDSKHRPMSAMHPIATI